MTEREAGSEIMVPVDKERPAMATPDESVLLRTAEQIADDIKSNKAPPPAKPLTGTDLAAGLTIVQARLTPVIAALQQHAGLITAAEDFCAALERQGVTWAGTAGTVVAGIPGALDMAEEDIPWAITLLAEFAAAPDANNLAGAPSPFRGR